MDIRPCSVDEIFESGLLDEYAEECRIPGMPAPRANRLQYDALENAGMIHCIGVFFEETLAGFTVLLNSSLPHYSQRVVVTESLFVAKAYRNKGAGLKLIRSVFDYANNEQAAGCLISSPSGGKLDRLLDRMGCTLSSRVYFRRSNV